MPSFFSLFTFCVDKHQKRLQKVIKYAKNIHKVHKVGILYQIVC